MSDTVITSVPAPPAQAETADAGKIRFGGSFRLLPVAARVEAAGEVKDSGRIRTGGSFRLVAPRTA